MDEVDSLPERFRNVCRFCLSREQLLPLFIGTGFNAHLIDAIDLLLLKVDEGDGLPNTICDCCYRVMVNYAKFEAKAIESYRVLTSALFDPESPGVAPSEKESPAVQEVTTLHSAKGNDSSDVQIVDQEGEDSEGDIDADLDDPLGSRQSVQVSQQREQQNAHDSGKNRPRKKPCPICGKLVSQVSKHLPIHCASKLYQCEYCSKQFAYDTSLRKHLLIHQGIRKYRCQYCEQTFCDRSSQRYHEAKHRNERRFACGECAETFFTTSQLKQHTTLSHRGRAFECTLCRSTFAMKHHLNDHMLVHSDERPHSCTKCTKSFKRRRHLLLHMLKHDAQD